MLAHSDRMIYFRESSFDHSPVSLSYVKGCNVLSGTNSLAVLFG